MNKKHSKGWLKHGDFILLDIVSLQLCFILAYWIVRGYGNPYANDAYQYQAGVLFVSQLVVILFTNNYSGILRRKRFDEAVAVLKNTGLILMVGLVYLFVVHRSAVVSRLQYGITLVLFAGVSFLLRCANKKRIFSSAAGKKENSRAIVLITAKEFVDEAIEKLTGPDIYQDFFLTGIILMNSGSGETGFSSQLDIPVMEYGDEAIDRLMHGWVDEVFFLQPHYLPFPTELMNDLMLMGITVNYTMTALINDEWPIIDLRKLGKYKVLTNSVRFASPGQLLLKRVLDVIGGFFGCIVTGILFLFVAPAIYIKSPGPIFFTQERVGQNGKTFKMHKFRSMYMDAEERKAELLDQNNVKDGMMFKMDDDPRIIGSEKKDKNGRPKGIGNFIRNTSIDEFPQFFDVFIGNMSLVGWRPCTMEEWNKYDLQHRIRASMKPGITGMWQVSGRSTITDFDEVVRLDREYIENWDILLDIKILLKTVEVVFTGKGAK